MASCLFDVEFEPFWDRQLVAGVEHRDVVLSIPVADIVEVVALYAILIFDDSAHLDLWHAELKLFLVFIQSLFVHHRALQLGLNQFAVLHIIGRSLQSRHHLSSG